MADDEKREKNEDKPLTDKEEAFCHNYFLTLNRNKAAMAAGWTKNPKTIRFQSYKLWHDPRIQKRIAELREDWKERMGITEERVLLEHKRIAFSNMGDYCYWNESGVTFLPADKISRSKKAAIKKVVHEFWEDGGVVKVELHDKKGSLDALTNILGLKKPDRVEHSGRDGGPIEHKDVGLAEAIKKARERVKSRKE